MANNKPNPTGEYKVGTLTYSVYGERNIACRVYYPAEKTEGLSKPRYMSPELARSLSKVLMFPISYKKIEKGGDNYSECFENAPAAENKKFPLVVFNHGSGAYRESNSFMCIDLASHGYVVLCIAHPLLAAVVEHDNGTFEYAMKNLMYKTYDPYFAGARALMKFMKAKGTDEELAQQFDQIQNKYCKFLKSQVPLWVDDTDRAVEYARENLSDMIDWDKGIGVTGHSFGGAVAYSICQDKPEYSCGINLDGMLLGDHEGKTLKRPFMQINCKANINVSARAYLDHTEPVYRVLFNDMEHLGFSDLKYAVPVAKVVGKLPPDVAHENLCRCHLEFFDTYLKGTKKAPVLPDNDAVEVKILYNKG